jgi:hypothetical protein
VTDRLRWDPDLTTAESGRPFYRDPLRLGLVVGTATMMIGALLPWAEGHVGFLPKRFGGLDGASDGLILATFGFVLLLIARSRDFLEAPDGGRRWAPMLIGILCVGIWLLGRQSAEQAIASWVEDSGSGSIVGGFWLAGIGVFLVATLSSFASLRHHEGETSSPTALLRMPRRSDLGPLGATVGALAGAIAGGEAAVSMFPPTTVGAPLVFFAGIGFVLGAYAGRRVGLVLGHVLG